MTRLFSATRYSRLDGVCFSYDKAEMNTYSVSLSAAHREISHVSGLIGMDGHTALYQFSFLQINKQPPFGSCLLMRQKS